MGRRKSKRTKKAVTNAASKPSVAPAFGGIFGNNPAISQWGKKANTNKPSKVKAQVSKAKNMLGGVAQQQPLGEPMSTEKQVKLGQATATAQAAQGAQLQKDFQMANPNAPKMPAGIGIAGAPANTGKMMAPEGYKPQQASMPGSLMGSAQPRPSKGGQNPTGGKGAMRPSPRPNVQMTDSGAKPQSTTFSNPGGPPGMMARPRPNMSRGGKGGQSPIGGGKGGRRPSPSMGRPNPAASLPANTLASRMADGSAGPANPFSEMNQAQIGAMSENRAPMVKKAPAFKMRSKTSTTFKEMGSSGVNKKSAPTRKTSTGYKMPGYGKR